MKKFYVRLLSYANAMELIDFVNVAGKNSMEDDYAHIVVHGVSVQLHDKSEEDVKEFLNGLGVIYEIGEEHPTKVVADIVTNLKEEGVIK